MTAVEKPIEERLTERDRFANDVKSCCADLAETYCGDNSCVTCITDALMKLGYRRASEIAREVEEIIDEEINVWEKAKIDLYPRQDYYYASAVVVALSEIKEKLKKKYESEGEK